MMVNLLFAWRQLLVITQFWDGLGSHRCGLNLFLGASRTSHDWAVLEFGVDVCVMGAGVFIAIFILTRMLNPRTLTALFIDSRIITRVNWWPFLPKWALCFDSRLQDFDHVTNSLILLLLFSHFDIWNFIGTWSKPPSCIHMSQPISLVDILNKLKLCVVKDGFYAGLFVKWIIWIYSHTFVIVGLILNINILHAIWITHISSAKVDSAIILSKIVSPGFLLKFCPIFRAKGYPIGVVILCIVLLIHGVSSAEPILQSVVHARSNLIPRVDIVVIKWGIEKLEWSHLVHRFFQTYWSYFLIPEIVGICLRFVEHSRLLELTGILERFVVWEDAGLFTFLSQIGLKSGGHLATFILGNFVSH